MCNAEEEEEEEEEKNPPGFSREGVRAFPFFPPATGASNNPKNPIRPQVRSLLLSLSLSLRVRRLNLP